RDAGEQHETRADAVAGPAATQQVDGAEGEPWHVQHRAEQIERAEGPAVPAGRGRGRERGRGQREQGQGEGPGALVRFLRTGVADSGGLREEGCNGGGKEGEAGDHGGCEGTSAPLPLWRPAPRPGRNGISAWQKLVAHFENACTSSVALFPGACSTAEHRKDTRVTASSRRRIPEATVARLPLYYRALMETGERQVATISSERLAELAGVNAAKVRKDLSYLGSYGTRGVGYDVEYLLHEISRELGLTRDWPVAIVGIGNLGRALANYRGFGARGFRIVALFDSDQGLVGKEVGDLTIEPITALGSIVEERKITIGMIATPAPVAQEVADRLVDAGVRSILNFAPAVLTVPPGVSMRKVDLAIELQILSFYQLRRGADRAEQAGLTSHARRR